MIRVWHGHDDENGQAMFTDLDVEAAKIIAASEKQENFAFKVRHDAARKVLLFWRSASRIPQGCDRAELIDASVKWVFGQGDARYILDNLQSFRGLPKDLNSALEAQFKK